MMMVTKLILGSALWILLKKNEYSYLENWRVWSGICCICCLDDEVLYGQE